MTPHRSAAGVCASTSDSRTVRRQPAARITRQRGPLQVDEAFNRVIQSLGGLVSAAECVPQRSSLRGPVLPSRFRLLLLFCQGWHFRGRRLAAKKASYKAAHAGDRHISDFEFNSVVISILIAFALSEVLASWGSLIKRPPSTQSWLYIATSVFSCDC